MTSEEDVAIEDLHHTTELLTDSPAGQWVPDVLQNCLRRTIPLGEDAEGPVSATLVRYQPSDQSAQTAAPVLQIHGWTDYFYNLESAQRWTAAGHPFYALDLRKYGRSLRAHQTPGFIEDLADYDAELNAAAEIIAEDHPQAAAPVISAHSTGGLIAALWAERYPDSVSALVLNTPWLEVPGHSTARAAMEGILTPLNAVNPTAVVKVPRPETYWQSLSDQAQGEWQLHPLWRPRKSFPMAFGWLKAVFAGHRRVYSGLDLEVPILVLLSTRTVYRTHWTPDHQERDGVLDVDLLARRAVKLGRHVTVLRVPRAMHDVFASAEPVRSSAMDQAIRWVHAFVPREDSLPNSGTSTSADTDGQSDGK